MLKVAQIQFNPRLGQLRENLQEVELLLAQTYDQNLVILPELANTGYNFLDRKHAITFAETPEKSDYIEMLTAICKKNRQAIVSGFHEREGDELFNSSILITEKGIAGKYRKIHLFMNEKDIFSKGNLGLPVYQVEDFKLGMLICFDYLFPEVWRIMALKGADIIAHPSNLLTFIAYKVVPAQAVINKMFIFTTNRFGTEREITFSGKSFAVNSAGEVISEASSDSTEILKTIIDPLDSRNKMITARNHVLNDRFPLDYADIVAI